MKRGGSETAEKCGHNFKTSGKTGDQGGFLWTGKGLYGLLLFITRVQMDADSDHGGHKRVMFFCMYHHTVQTVVVQDAVVDTLRGGTLVINLLISV